MTARTDTATRDGVTVVRTWSEPAWSPTAYVVDQRCVACGMQVTDDDRGPFYDSVTDDGTAHVCPAPARADCPRHGDVDVHGGTVEDGRRLLALACGCTVEAA